MRKEDFEVKQVWIPLVGARYFVRRHPRVIGIRMPWTIRVRNMYFGGVSMFFTKKQADAQIASMCGEA